MSASIAPGSSTFAFWVAQQVLAGAKVPKDMTLPILLVTQEDLEQKLKETDKGGVTNKEYTLDEVKDFIAKAK
jgi:ribose transport system substrate-binding protein